MIYIYRTHDVPLKYDLDSMINKNFDNISFHRCFLTNFNMYSSSFYNCDFRSAEIKGSILDLANLKQAKLIMVEAMWTSFKNARLERALLFHSNFSFGNFSKANFESAQLKNSIFVNCDLRGAILTCEGVESCDFLDAIYNKETQCNVGIDLEKLGAKYCDE